MAMPTTIDQIKETIEQQLEDYDCYCRDADGCKDYKETGLMVEELAIKIFEILH